MNIEEFRQFCLALGPVEETFPFDEVTLVFKIGGKMFALTGLDSPEFAVNLKCDPEKSAELREKYEEVQPGFHMNKLHWNTVNFEGSLSDDFLKDLIRHSYDLIVSKLPRKILAEINMKKGEK